jgi:hypothetical protein
LFDRLGHQVPIEECLPGGHRLLIVHVPAREPFRAPTNDACAGVLYLDLTSAQDRKSLREPQWAGLAGALTAK